MDLIELRDIYKTYHLCEVVVRRHDGYWTGPVSLLRCVVGIALTDSGPVGAIVADSAPTSEKVGG